MSLTDKFRPVHWSDINQPGAPIIGWGLERKAAGERFYKPVGYHGKIHPFATKKEAQAVCDELNTKGVTSPLVTRRDCVTDLPRSESIPTPLGATC